MESFLQSDYTLLGSSMEFNILNDTADPIAHRLARHMTVLPLSQMWSNTSILTRYKAQHGVPVALMSQQGFETHGQLKVVDCPMTILAVSNIQNTKSSNIFAKKDSPYRGLFDREYLVLLEHGFLQHLHTISYMRHKKYRRYEMGRCIPKPFSLTGVVSQNKPIAWMSVSFLYWFLLGLCLAAFCCLLLERLIDGHRS
ncbi:hypothetical protein BV898_15887 [Hypsibius exemplaris]|uniref:Uncharacterized protein n=1 Tax=Hypsibius exemplaris TaxID=2072580 RepID=A0A9X6NDQ9_HYPEX|nr:hypothetical protein BV898_15887 [Hypsibius exemplaris]